MPPDDVLYFAVTAEAALDKLKEEARVLVVGNHSVLLEYLVRNPAAYNLGLLVKPSARKVSASIIFHVVLARFGM
jgi:hypothetical protein